MSCGLVTAVRHVEGGASGDLACAGLAKLLVPFNYSDGHGSVGRHRSAI